jgi:dsDNA-specific endonuclease/ATPase MutS2
MPSPFASSKGPASGLAWITFISSPLPLLAIALSRAAANPLASGMYAIAESLGCSNGSASAAARCASEEAYQRLRIGTDAKAAYESAKRERDEALALHREAEKVLDDAKAKAAKLVAEAEAIKADAEKTRADADELHQCCGRAKNESTSLCEFSRSYPWRYPGDCCYPINN